MHTYSETLDYKTHRCAKCKRVFEIPYYVTEWGYWYAGKICCGYKCMRALQAKDRPEMSFYAQERKSNPRAPLTQSEIVQIEKLLFRGVSARQVAIQMKRSESAVGKIRKRLVSEGWIIQS